LLRSFLTSFVATILFVAIVLVSAGRVTLWQAWVYGGISLALNLAQRLILRERPELARERARPHPDARRWDKVLLGLGLVLTLAMLVTAGLEFRYSSIPSLSLVAFGVGVVLNLTGAFFFLWALRENRFFSALVRRQSDRGHAVCTTGPYRVVRHPGNLGMIIGTLGFPLLFRAVWSFVPAGIAVVVLLLRTGLEDAYLTAALDGYREYRKRTRFRLVPGLW
jgi:protein-S-isoprenylcysteine O-methyltransferase Ste14